MKKKSGPPCPFGDPLPRRRKTHLVPPAMRDQFVAVARTRRELNDNNDPLRSGEYFARSRIVEEQFCLLLWGLRGHAKLSGLHTIELHTNWRFSAKTGAQYRRAYRARKKKARVEAEPSGLSHNETQKWPDSSCDSFLFQPDPERWDKQKGLALQLRNMP